MNYFTRKVLIFLLIYSAINLSFAQQNDFSEFVAFSPDTLLVGSTDMKSALNDEININIVSIDPICENTDFTLEPTGEDVDFYEWYEKTADGERKISSNKIHRVRNLAQTTTYILKAFYLKTELSINGNFENPIDWNIHKSDYYRAYSTPWNITLWDDKTYYIDDNPKEHNSNFSDYGDHTTGFGNMFMVNGASSSDDRIWYQEKIPIEPNLNYAFSCWAKSIIPGNPAKLRFAITTNDSSSILDKHLDLNSDMKKWENAYVLWNSGNNTEIDISILNMQTNNNGNCFALDDISFYLLMEVTREITVVVYPDPKIANLPDQHVCLGSDVVINAANPGIDYSSFIINWTKNGQPVTDPNIAINNMTLSIVKATTDNEGEYSCTITNSCGTKTTTFDLFIENQTQIGQQPVGGTFCENEPVTLSISATGPQLMYQWYKDGVALSGATDKTHAFNAGLFYTGNYYCLVTSNCGLIKSDIVEVVVNKNTVITRDLILNPVCSGNTVYMEIDADGSGTLNYQWYLGTKAIPRAVSKQYSITPTMADNGSNYYCIVNSSTGCGTATGTTRTLQVYQTTQITVPLVDNTSCAGDNHTFTTEAQAENITYLWKHDGVVLAGETSSSLTLNNIQLVDSGAYTCEVSGDCGVLTSTANLTVHQITRITNNLSALSQCPGTDVTYSITSEGTINKYTWEHNGADLNLNQTSITLNGITSAEDGNYVCTVEGVCGVDSKETVLTVLTATQVIDSLNNTVGCMGGTAEFTINTIGEDIAFSWEHEGVPLTADAPTLSLSGLTPVDAGAYKVTASGTCGTVTGSATLGVDTTTNITSAFGNQTACEGQNVTLSVTAEGNSKTYKWYKDGTIIPGENNASLNLNNVATGNSGLYKCEVTGNCGNDEVEARLDVYKNTNIVTNISDIKECVGNSVSFIVSATGDNLTYSWTKDGIDQGVSRSTFTIQNLVEGDIGTQPIICRVTGECGTLISEADLTVYPLTKITSGISNQEVCENSNITFSVTATGEALSYEWWHGTVKLTEVSNTLTLNNVTTDDAGNYKCIVKGRCNNKETNATLTIYKNAAKNSGLSNIAICEGEDITFRVDFSGSGLQYEWKKDGVVTGGNKNTYSLNDIAPGDAATYTCRVFSSYGCGDITETSILTVNPETTVTTQPVGKTVCEGSLANYTVTAGGTAPFTYQWYQGAVIMVGETVATLTINPANVADDGKEYYCKVSGACSSALSDKAKLNVNKNVVIITQPQGMTIAANSNAVFSVVADGAPVLQYQWFENGIAIPAPDGTNSTLTILATNAKDNFDYHCEVSSPSGCGGTVLTNIANLNVDVTQITEQPISQAICEGIDAVFTVKAEGDVTFEWRRVSDNAIMPSLESVEVPGPSKLTRSQMTVVNPTMGENGEQYYCIITGPVVTNISITATLTVKPNTTIAAGGHPVDQTVCPGTNAVFEATANGAGAFTYQWFDNSNNTIGNARTLVLAGNTTNAGKSYRCEISSSNGCSTATSNPAALNLFQETQIITHLDPAPACEGSDKTLKVVANASAPITYTWTHNGNPVGFSSNEEIVSGVNTTDAGVYVVKVEGKCGSAESSVNLEIKKYPSITQNLSDVTKCEGEDMDLVVDASGSDLIYKWYKDETINAAVTGNIYNLPNLKTADADVYKCTVSNICDTKTTSAVVTVKEPVAITTALFNPDACEGDNIALEILANGDDRIYEWSKGGAIITGETQPTFNINKASANDVGQYAVKVSNLCNEKTSSTDLTINKNNILIKGFKGKDYCEGENIELTVFADGIDLQYTWSKNGNIIRGNQSQYNIPKATTNDSGEYKCIITGKCGDTLVVKENILVHPVTQITKTFGNKTICEGSPLILETEVKGDNLSFVWMHNNNDLLINNDTLIRDNVAPSESGVYTMKVNGICGEDISTAQLIVKEKTQLINGLKDREIKCEESNVVYNVDASGTNLTYTWYYNNNPVSSRTGSMLQLNKVMPDTSGIYKCIVNGDCGFSETESELIVHPKTRLLASLKDAEICEGTDTTLKLLVQGANLTYSWDFKGTILNDTTANLELTNVIPAQSGKYICSATGYCGAIEDNAELNIRSKTKLDYQTTDQVVCETEPSVSFEVNASGEDLIYQWEKDEQVIIGANNPVLVISPIYPEDEGVYQCIISSSCGEVLSSQPARLTINRRSKIIIQPRSRDACENSDVEFEVQATGLELVYQWRKNGVDIIGATDSIYRIPAVHLTDSGDYDCVVTSACGDSIVTLNTRLETYPAPNSSIAGRMELCSGEQEVIYKAPLNPELNYKWTLDNGYVSSDDGSRRVEVNWDIARRGALHLIVESRDTRCTNSIDSLVELLPLPKVNLTPFDTIGACHPSFALTGAGPEGGIFHIDGKPSKIFDMKQGPGEYTINYTFTDENGCSGSSKHQRLIVEPLPTIRACQKTYDIGECEKIRLSALSTANNYFWEPGNNLDNGNVQAPWFIPGSTQRLRVHTTDKYGCSSHDYIYINVDTLPKVSTIPDTTIGSCQQIILNTKSRGGQLEQIQWNYIETLDKSNILSPVLKNPDAGTYYYTINVKDTHGCSAKDSVKITIIEAPKLGDDQHICEDEEITVNLEEFKSFYWEDGYIEKLRILNDTGVYRVYAENEFGCIDEMLISIHPNPVINLKDTSIFQGQSVDLDPNLDSQFEPYECIWQDGSIFPIFTAHAKGYYAVKVTDNAGCESFKEIFLEIKAPYLKTPNAFLPESSDENNRFYIKEVNYVDDITLYIYNRWGELLFSSSEMGYNGGWDGTYMGNECQAGSYVWMIFSKGKMLEHGSVTLIR